MYFYGVGGREVKLLTHFTANSFLLKWYLKVLPFPPTPKMSALGTPSIFGTGIVYPGTMCCISYWATETCQSHHSNCITYWICLVYTFGCVHVHVCRYIIVWLVCTLEKRCLMSTATMQEGNISQEARTHSVHKGWCVGSEHNMYSTSLYHHQITRRGLSPDYQKRIITTQHVHKQQSKLCGWCLGLSQWPSTAEE
jgi:hypothetical protein